MSTGRNSLNEPQVFRVGNAYATAIGITASTTQSQAAATPVDGEYVTVSTCANANDSVKLPAATVGRVLHIKNEGAANLRIYPALGDKLNGGTIDAADATALAAAGKRTYVCFVAGDWDTY